MAATSIIDIEVRDAAFNQLKASFDAFNAEVKKQPAAWGAVHKQAMQVATDLGFAQGAMQGTEKAAGKVGDALGKAAKSQSEVNRLALAGRKLFSDMAEHGSKLASHVSSITKQMLSWVGVGSVFSGLLGAGGLYGLDRFAHSASSVARSAQGIGVSSGEQRSFRLNYGRYVEPDSFLQRVAEAKNDYTKQAWFNSLGIKGDVSKMDTQDLAMQVFRAGRTQYMGSDRSSQFVQSRGLDNFFTMDELRRSAKYSDADVAGSEADTRRGNQQLAVDPAIEGAWRKLSTALDGAAEKIETTLIKGLAPLAGPLAGISDKFADLAKTLLETPALKEWMTAFASGLESLNKWMGSPEFKTDVESFAKHVGELAKAIAAAVAWIFEKTSGMFGNSGTKVTESGGFESQSFVGDTSKSIFFSHNMPFVPANVASLSDAAATRNGVPLSFARGVFASEGGLDANGNPLTSPKGAVGAGQLMPGTAAHLRVDASKMDENIDGSVRYMKELLEQFHNKLAVAAAAYNAGPYNSGVSHFNQTGDESQLPDETKRYLKKMRDIGALPPIDGQPAPPRSSLDRVLGLNLGAPTLATGEINGHRYQIAQQHKEATEGFLRELAATGYKIDSVGGYNDRNIAGTDIKSFHASGAAFDVNPSDNPVNGRNNLPSNISAMAHKYGLGWGGDWKGGKTDPMHFSFAKEEGGDFDIQHRNAVQQQVAPPVHRAPSSDELNNSLNRVLGLGQKISSNDYPGGVKINIFNNTGGSAIVTAGALAA